MIEAVSKSRDVKLVIQNGGDGIGYYMYVYNLEDKYPMEDWLYNDMQQALDGAKSKYNIDESQFKEAPDITFPKAKIIYEAVSKSKGLDVLLKFELGSVEHRIAVYNIHTNGLIEEHFFSTVDEALKMANDIYKVTKDAFKLISI